jgi:hypothetical protein
MEGDEHIDLSVIEGGGDDAPVAVEDAALSGEFDSLDGPAPRPNIEDAPAHPAKPPEPEDEPAKPAGDAPATPSEPPPAVLPSPGKTADQVPPAAAAVQPVSPPVSPAAVHPSSLKPSDVLADMSAVLGDVELLDESAEGGKVKFADLAKDSPSFMQAAAVMAQVMVDKALAPYRNLMPVMQQQADVQQRESMLSSIEQAGISDARALVETNEYWNWVDAQPPEIKAAADSLNPLSVARVMKLYQAETGHTPQAAQAQQQQVADAKAKVAAVAKKSASLHTGVETPRAASAPSAGAEADPKKLKEDFENLPDD